MLRIYAMYGRTRTIAAVGIILAIAEAIFAGVVVGIPRPGSIGTFFVAIFRPAYSPLSAHIDTNNPAPGVYICADGDPPHDHRFAYTWTIVLVGESVFVVLSLYKGWQDWRTGYGSSVLRILTRESVFYFIAYVFALSL